MGRANMDNKKAERNAEECDCEKERLKVELAKAVEELEYLQNVIHRISGAIAAADERLQKSKRRRSQG